MRLLELNILYTGFGHTSFFFGWDAKLISKCYLFMANVRFIRLSEYLSQLAVILVLYAKEVF